MASGVPAPPAANPPPQRPPSPSPAPASPSPAGRLPRPSSPTLQLRRKQQQGGLASAISGMHVGEMYNITAAPLPHQLLHGLLQVGR
jgi:hypothetical protein